MVEFFFSHPYFFANLTTLITVHFFSFFLLSPVQHKLLILGGLMNAVCFPFLVLLENEYWMPNRIGDWKLGIEDALCSYDVAALLLLVIFCGTKISSDIQLRWKIFFRRYLISGFLISVVFLSGLLLGLRGMTSLIVTQACILPFLFCLRPGVWSIVIKGILLYPLVYWILVRIYFWVWPEFILEWNLAGPWGEIIFGIPVGEFFWALGFASWWPFFFAFLFDLDLERNGNLIRSWVQVESK